MSQEPEFIGIAAAVKKYGISYPKLLNAALGDQIQTLKVTRTLVCRADVERMLPALQPNPYLRRPQK